MKYFLICILCGLLVSSVQADDRKSIGSVTFPIGDNFVQPTGKVRWSPVSYNMIVHDRDKIKTKKQSRCEVTFTNRKVMRIGENSIVELTKDEAGTENVSMSKGSAWLSLFLPKGKSRLRMRTPSSVCAIRGTVYRLECDSNQTTYRCYQGELAITPFKEDGQTLADSSFDVGAGEELILVKDFEEYRKQQEKAFREFKERDMDEFERFKQQDQQQFREMVERDLAEFKKMQNINYRQKNFDLQEDNNSDWVQWNKERDKLIQN